MARSRPRRKNQSMKTNLKVAKKFWRYMQDSNQFPTTRTELRHLHKTSFSPVLTEPMEQKVTFCSILWCFRSKHMKIIEWRATEERESIVYKPGRRPEDAGEGVDNGFDELKKKLVGER